MNKRIVDFFWVVGAITAIPFGIMLGFFVSYQLYLHFDTPRYEYLKLPLRTDYFTGCEVFSEIDIKDPFSKKVVGEDIAWHPCSSYKKYLENKAYDQVGNGNSD